MRFAFAQKESFILKWNMPGDKMSGGLLCKLLLDIAVNISIFQLIVDFLARLRSVVCHCCLSDRLKYPVTFAGLTAAELKTTDALAVDTLCGSTVCIRNSTCRVVQACAGSVCSPKITCLDCVPKGADDACYKNGFSVAVLIGSMTQASALIGRGCDHNQPDGEPNCPTGSRCVPDDSSGRGTCCYGKQDPAQQTAYNNASFCRSECGECQPEHVCKKILAVCKRLPCLPRYNCVQREKKGSCPRYTTLGSSWCSRNKRVRCNNDLECFGSQKCCSDPCGGLRCKRPRN